MNRQQIHLILLYEFKLGNNAALAARNINRAWGPLTTNKRTSKRWFTRFQETRVLKKMKVEAERILSGGPPESCVVNSVLMWMDIILINYSSYLIIK